MPDSYLQHDIEKSITTVTPGRECVRILEEQVQETTPTSAVNETSIFHSMMTSTSTPFQVDSPSIRERFQDTSPTILTATQSKVEATPQKSPAISTTQRNVKNSIRKTPVVYKRVSISTSMTPKLSMKDSQTSPRRITTTSQATQATNVEKIEQELKSKTLLIQEMELDFRERTQHLQEQVLREKSEKQQLQESILAVKKEKARIEELMVVANRKI